TGIRYFADDPTQPGTGVLASWRFPLFDPEDPNAASLPTSASLDPLDPVSTLRSYFGLVAPGQTSGPALTSFYVTNMGYRLSLTPSFPAGTDASLLPRFVLTVKASSTQTQPYDFYYLAPAGMFTLSVVVTKQPIAGANPVQRVVCGTSGLEYLGLMQSGGNLMYFFPAQAAYAGGFGGGSSSAAGLSKVAQTSWAYLTGPGGASLNYYAQPLGAALYSGGTSQNFASFLELWAELCRARS